MPDSPNETLDHATQLRETGHFEESRAMLERLVAQAIHRSGRKAYDSQCAMSQLGRTLRVMGRAEEASALHWEVLAIRLDAYGRGNTFTTNSAAILSETLRDCLHDEYTAASVESWFAQPELPRETICAGKPLTAAELRQAILEHESAAAQNIARLVDEYLKFSSTE